ncbi:sigma-54-dependent Fis family transcriptional regulator [candidate division KSB1 bacterium]|nr:sigma-54-dependent Fis family transcriptional regulator [candidate division KSB1 bacterium]
MRKLNALLIDDDPQFCKTFKLLSKHLFDLTLAHSSKDGFSALKRETTDVVLLDYKLNEEKTGLDVLKEIRATYPDLPVIMITEHGEIDLAVEAMRLGAVDFTTKSPNIQSIRLRIEHQLKQINWKVLCQSKDDQLYGPLIFKSRAMEEIISMLNQIAGTEFPVLIQGETGTGKGMLAREIHRRSPRKDNPFVAINCSNLPPNLFESELFGYVKGAFTGAVQSKKGKLELADGGTIFLDEIGALNIESQAKILTTIEDKFFMRLGAEQQRSVDVRVISATNLSLEEAIQNKTFREDLYYRLNVVPLKLPPLRERRDDIIPLAEYFLANISTSDCKQLSETARQTLLKYDWKGNVRELKSAIQRSTLFNSGDVLDKIFLDNSLASSKPDRDWEQLYTMPYESAKHKLIADFQKSYFERLLRELSGNISAAANAAGINRATLHRLLNELGLRTE